VGVGRAPSDERRAPLLWVDGRRVDPARPQLSAFDRGFTLSDGLFETMLARGGRIFRLGPHLARLERGARTLGIPLQDSLEPLIARALQEASAEGLAQASVRLTVSRGPGPAGVAAPHVLHPTIVLAIQPLPDFPPALYERGLAAITAAGRRNERSLTAGLKTLAYADAIMALAQAQAVSADEAIFLDTEGHVSEATASNVFALVHDTLVTPPRSCGVLRGITRAAVLELATTLGLRAEERVLAEGELRAASEAFLTSSLRAVAPLVILDGRPIGTSAPGPITQRVMDAYAALVRRECAP
jgi:branched-chain amino acid aminotransferase